MRRGSGRRRLLVVAAGLLIGAVVPAVPIQAQQAGPSTALHLTGLSGTNGVGKINTPGRSCAAGGDGAYWHYDYSTPLQGLDPKLDPTGEQVKTRFSYQPGEVRLHLDLHSEDAGRPAPNAFLLGGESHASLINDRGTVKLRLKGGDCAKPGLSFNGTTASGSGAWEVDTSTGAYRNATGTGTFTIHQADVAPGADNPFRVDLAGSLTVQQPSLSVPTVEAYWGNLGLDYLLRRLTVVYEVKNEGPGDAFSVQFTSAQPKDVGTAVTVVPPAASPTRLGDLRSGQSDKVKVRYRLGTGNPPCDAVLLQCRFGAEVKVSMLDALDRTWAGSPTTQTVQVAVPDFPPPIPPAQ